MIKQVGVALGEECQAEDVAILLGPAANIKRSPLCGRNFEYFSEDPYLSSEMASSHIEGVQSQGVGTSLKHFAVNNQEHRRMTTSAEVDERTLREIYLASFEGAVKQSQPWTVMCAYNQVNGEFCSENAYLLTDILKGEWGHEGFVVSDWGAVNERVDGLSAGLELEMPGNGGERDKMIIDAVRSGDISEDILDKAVERLLNIIFRAVDKKKENASYDAAVHHELARKVARESMVLLKNEDGILPLKQAGNVAVIGAFAQTSRYQGGGSSHVRPTKLENVYEEITRTMDNHGDVTYASGYVLDNDEIDQRLIDEAKETATKSDVALVFAGLPDRYESEGYDREHMQIPMNQQKLIEEVSAVQPNTVVVLSNGSPIEMFWIKKVKGVLECYLGGQAGGGAVSDIVFGKASPCGKLAETFPKQLSDNPSHLNFPGEDDKVGYHEGLFVGYRYYDTKGMEPLFPFGYGLSYTTFEYSDLTVDSREIRDDETVNVHVTVKNMGSLTGKEIVQVYVKDNESSVTRPEKELKGFAKVALEPGEEKTVSFTLDKRAFAYYDVERKDWHVETGDFTIAIAKSSRDIVLAECVRVVSTRAIAATYDRNSTIGDLLNDERVARVVEEKLQTFTSQSGLADALKDNPDMAMAMFRYMPLRGLVSFGEGEVTEGEISEFIQQLNA